MANQYFSRKEHIFKHGNIICKIDFVLVKRFVLIKLGVAYMILRIVTRTKIGVWVKYILLVKCVAIETDSTLYCC